MASQDFVDVVLALDDFLGLDLDVGDLAGDAAARLVDHDLGVGQGQAAALGATGQEHGRARCGQADAVGGHGALDELHGVVDGQGVVDRAARAIDVEADALGPVLELEVEKLLDDVVGHGVVDRTFQEDDAVFQQKVGEGHLALAGVVLVALEDRGREGLIEGHGRFSWRE